MPLRVPAGITKGRLRLDGGRSSHSRDGTRRSPHSGTPRATPPALGSAPPPQASGSGSGQPTSPHTPNTGYRAAQSDSLLHTTTYVHIRTTKRRHTHDLRHGPFAGPLPVKKRRRKKEGVSRCHEPQSSPSLAPAAPLRRVPARATACASSRPPWCAGMGRGLWCAGVLLSQWARCRLHGVGRRGTRARHRCASCAACSSRPNAAAPAPPNPG